MVVGVADDEGWHSEDGKARERKKERGEKWRERERLCGSLTSPSVITYSRRYY